MGDSVTSVGGRRSSAMFGTGCFVFLPNARVRDVCYFENTIHAEHGLSRGEVAFLKLAVQPSVGQ